MRKTAAMGRKKDAMMVWNLSQNGRLSVSGDLFLVLGELGCGVAMVLNSRCGKMRRGCLVFNRMTGVTQRVGEYCKGGLSFSYGSKEWGDVHEWEEGGRIYQCCDKGGGRMLATHDRGGEVCGSKCVE